ncbi:MAG: hypothetical protein ABW065_13535 [Solirubrobacterales bacterium]
MSKMWSRRPSPALIVAIAALVMAMAGTTYAATQLAKNSVGTKQLKKDAVTGAKVKNGTLTGSDIDIASLGNVPSASNSERANLADRALTADSVGTAKTAQNADHANTAGHATTADSASEADHATTATTASFAATISSAGPIRIVGAAGEPPFLNGSENRVLAGVEYQPVGFYKDPAGIVHLEGVVKPGTVDPEVGLLFELPQGYRPAAGKFVAFEPTNGQSVLIGGTGAKLQTVATSGMVLVPNPTGAPIPLGGITFLAQG